MRKWQFLTTISAMGVASLITYYASYMVYADWVSQAPFRAADAQKREIQQRWNRINDAADRLESHGASFPAHKGHRFHVIDFSQWHAGVSEFNDLRVLAELPTLRSAWGGTLFIRLGPN